MGLWSVALLWAVVAAILKLTGTIAISWGWVFGPAVVILVLSFVLFAAVLFLAAKS